jgi:hypothetical protein
MKNSETSALFTPWTDPVSGVTSQILTPRVAPVQQSFYFTSPSMTEDGRWLWFYTAHPPAGSADAGRALAVADLERGTVRTFPETAFRDASPMVDPVTGEVYWCSNYAVYRRGPREKDRVEKVNELPEELHRNRMGKRLATHLTFSADRRELFVDAHLGREWILGSLPLDGGAFGVWKRLDRCHNHAQFSPADPDCALVARDWWLDVATGERHEYDNRMWLLRRDGSMRPLMEGASRIAHEWWDAGGRHVWFVDYDRGTGRIDIESLETEWIWPGGTVHSHASRCGRWLVGDVGTYSWQSTGCRVLFLNRETGRETAIVSDMPLPPLSRGSYHLDPHPQFVAGDEWIVYTTMVRGTVDVARTRVADLLAAG